MDYFRRFALDRKKRTLYCEITADKDATDAILLYPDLAKVIFSELKKSLCDVSQRVYEVSKQYAVDAVVILYGYGEEKALLRIKNGTVVDSIL